MHPEDALEPFSCSKLRTNRYFLHALVAPLLQPGSAIQFQRIFLTKKGDMDQNQSG